MSDAERHLVAELARVVREHRDLIVRSEQLPDGTIPDSRVRAEVEELDRLLELARVAMEEAAS